MTARTAFAPDDRHTKRWRPCGSRPCRSMVTSRLVGGWILDVDIRKFFERVVQPRLKDRAFLIRYADDFVMGFSYEEDARRVLDVLPKRFGKYGLTLHPAKTRLVPFQRPPRRSARKDSIEGSQPGSFDLLGFTHYWSLSRKGNWVVKRKTAKSRLTRALRTVARCARWCRVHRHQPIAEQHRTLSGKLKDPLGSGSPARCRCHTGITGNGSALAMFHREVTRTWRKWLSRRHRRGGYTWPQFTRLLERYTLPRPVVVHSVYRRAANP